MTARECAYWFFDNIITWSYCVHRPYSMTRKKNSILINDHAQNREPVPLSEHVSHNKSNGRWDKTYSKYILEKKPSNH